MSGVTGGCRRGRWTAAQILGTSAGGPFSAIVPTRSTSDANANDNVIIQASSALRVENQMWAQISQENARMLGYASLADAELQRYRYFVVLQAYDNRTLSQKKPKLLWEARLSISEHRNLFDKRLGRWRRMPAPISGRTATDSCTRRARRICAHRPDELAGVSHRARGCGPGRRWAHVAYLRRERSETGLAVVDVDKPEGDRLRQDTRRRGAPESHGAIRSTSG